MNKLNRITAAAATTTVLILGSLSAIVASLMLFQSTDNAIVARVLREGKKAEYAAMACGEVALEKLRLSTSYVGNEAITVSGTVTCNIGTITNASGVYTVPTSAVSGESTKRLQITVGTITTTLNITSWKEL